MAAARARGLEIQELGRVGAHPLLYLSPRAKPLLLVAGGFHGDEPAGSWAILRWLETAPEPAVPVGFLPLVNPTGYALGTRLNAAGMDPNRGFFTDRAPLPSMEGQILLDRLDHIAPAEAFLTLHEARDADGFFLLAFEDTPSQFSARLLLTGVEQFGLDTRSFDFLRREGSFEDYLYHEGLQRAACTETPVDLDQEARIRGNVALIETFVELYS